MPLSQFFFRPTFSCEIYILAIWIKIAPGQTPVKLNCNRKEWHFCINRQETIHSHSFPVGPSGGRKKDSSCNYKCPHHYSISHDERWMKGEIPPPSLVSIPTCREATQGGSFQGDWAYNRSMPNLSTNKRFCRFNQFLKTYTPGSLPIPDFGLQDLSSKIPVA